MPEIGKETLTLTLNQSDFDDLIDYNTYRKIDDSNRFFIRIIIKTVEI